MLNILLKLWNQAEIVPMYDKFVVFMPPHNQARGCFNTKLSAFLWAVKY